MACTRSRALPAASWSAFILTSAPGRVVYRSKWGSFFCVFSLKLLFPNDIFLTSSLFPWGTFSWIFCSLWRATSPWVASSIWQFAKCNIVAFLWIASWCWVFASSNKVWVRSIIPNRHLWQLLLKAEWLPAHFGHFTSFCAFAIVVTDLTACGTVVYFAGIFGMTKFLTVEAAQWVRDVDWYWYSYVSYIDVLRNRWCLESNYEGVSVSSAARVIFDGACRKMFATVSSYLNGDVTETYHANTYKVHHKPVENLLLYWKILQILTNLNRIHFKQPEVGFMWSYKRLAKRPPIIQWAELMHTVRYQAVLVWACDNSPSSTGTHTGLFSYITTAQ